MAARLSLPTETHLRVIRTPAETYLEQVYHLLERSDAVPLVYYARQRYIGSYRDVHTSEHIVMAIE